MEKDFGDLKHRFIFAACAILALILLICFSQNIVAKIIITCLLAALVSGGLWEYYLFVKMKQISIPIWLIIVLGICYIVACFLLTFSVAFNFLLHLIIAVFFFSVFIIHFHQIEGSIVKVATSFFGAFYVVIPLSLVLRILYPTTLSFTVTDGRMWLAYLLCVTKVTDIGGYFLGKLWGNKKLAEQISPNKTIVGGFGGFLAAIIFSLIFYVIGIFLPRTLFTMSFIQALILGGLIGIFGQLGDLAESLLKRDANIKDSSKIPAIGGVLDLLDSLLFTSPIVYLFLKTI